jgi:hypothetical protein
MAIDAQLTAIHLNSIQVYCKKVVRLLGILVITNAAAILIIWFGVLHKIIAMT